MFILFDIGGTKMRIAASRDLKEFAEPIIVPTPKDFDEGMKVFSELVEQAAAGEPVEAAGGGIAGPLDDTNSELVNSPNISGWINKPLKERMEQAVSAPVFLENDTAIVALGEARAGAGKGYGIVAYITVSTGVGGARIVDGRVDCNVYGFEPGHQIIDMVEKDHPKDLEGHVSGRAVEERFGKKPYEINDARVWDELARLLAYGLNNSIVHWSPDVVVLGGSMIVGKPAIDVAAVQNHLKKILTIYPKLPDIKKATLGDVGGLYGAAVFIKQHINKV